VAGLNIHKKLLHKELSYQIQGAAIEVRKNFGPGHKESIYQMAFEEELKARGVKFEREKSTPVHSPKTGKVIGSYKPDFIVDDKIIVELKALDNPPRKLVDQLYDYLRNTRCELGYFINFSSPRLFMKRIIFTNDRKPWLKLLVAISLIFVVFRVPAAQATEFTSPSFKVLDPVLDIFGGESQSTSFIQLQAGGQLSIGISTSSSFILKSGFLYFPGPPTPAPSPSVSPAPIGGVGLGGARLFPASPPPRRPTPRFVDLNGDGRINLIDVSILLYWWAKNVTPQALAAIGLPAFDFPSPDINADLRVDIVDLSIILFYWTG